jgi:hypothetical protein
MIAHNLIDRMLQRIIRETGCKYAALNFRQVRMGRYTSIEWYGYRDDKPADVFNAPTIGAAVERTIKGV